MLCPPEQRFKFFIYVVESPSPLDFYHRREEGGWVGKVAALNQIECVTRTAISAEAFEASLGIGLSEAMESNPGYAPILHISAHGWREGIALSDGTRLEWPRLKNLLRPVNSALQNNLVVCMSSCEGYAGQRMAMHPEDDNLPFFALIGNFSKPTWSETAVAYATFYHQLHRGAYVGDAVDAMRAASGNDNFFYVHGDQARQGYLDFLASEEVREAQQQLASVEPSHQTEKGGSPRAEFANRRY